MTNDRKTIKEEKKLFEQKVRQELNDYMAETNEKNIDLDKMHELVELLIALDGDKITDFDVEEAYQRFENRFLKNDEPKKEKRNSRFNRRKAGRIVGFAAAIIFVVFIGGNIGTYATKQMGLVSFIREMDNGVKFHKEEGYMLSENTIEVNDFDKIPDEYRMSIYYPTFIPNDLKLKKVKISDSSKLTKYILSYGGEESEEENYLKILVVVFKDDFYSLESESYSEMVSVSGSFELQGEEINIYVNNNNEKVCSFSVKGIWYKYATDMENNELERVIKSMEKGIS